MNTFYEIISHRVSHREYWWGNKSPLVLLGWIIKWLHIRIPSSTDDPNTESTRPFVVASLPVEVANGFVVPTTELACLGFSEPVYHVINDPGTRTTVYWATFRHESGKYSARIHQRIWQQSNNPRRGLFAMFFTAFSDGTFLVSSAGKPDMTAPETVQMNRMYRAGIDELWRQHQELSEALEQRKLVVPVRSPDELVEMTERHHVLVRDFHLARGVFRPRTAAEQAQAESFAASVAQAQVSGLEHGEVMAELEKLQEAKGGWGASVWVLVGSVVLFLALGAANWNWKFTLWLIPILFFHECGHWAAMRIFHYRNLRMFFIPLFGAAVMGQNWNVPGWKKALVSLAGPLPGIALGILLGVTGLVYHLPWLSQTAFLLLILNGFNLLPFLPLDGGHVLHTTLFCRNRWLDVAFRIVAIITLFMLSVWQLGKVFMYLAIFMAINLPLAFKLAKITDTLRDAELPPPTPGHDRIPVPTAQAIITAIKQVLPAKTSNKALAQHTVNIFETLNARPPGALGTIGLLLLQGGGIFLAVMFGIVLFISKNGGGLGEFARAAARQPMYAVECGAWQSWAGETARQGPPAVRDVLVATFKGHDKAVKAFGDLTKQAAPDQRVTLYGDSLLVALPSTDGAAREKWFDQLQLQTTNLFVAPSNQPVSVRLMFLVPTLTEATNLTRELNNYFDVMTGLHLIPPWAPEAKGSTFQAWTHARAEWTHITEELGKVGQDKAFKEYPAKIRIAGRRGNVAEQRRLETELGKVREELEAQTRERLRAEDPARADLLELQARWSGLSYTNRAERAALLRDLGPKLGEVKMTGDHPAPGADDYGAPSGMARQHGMMIEISWLSLNEPATGLTTLSSWLCQRGCIDLRYEFIGGFSRGEYDDEED